MALLLRPGGYNVPKRLIYFSTPLLDRSFTLFGREILSPNDKYCISPFALTFAVFPCSSLQPTIVFRKSLHLVFKSINNILEDTSEDARESKDEGLSYEL